MIRKAYFVYLEQRLLKLKKNNVSLLIIMIHNIYLLGTYLNIKLFVENTFILYIPIKISLKISLRMADDRIMISILFSPTSHTP